LLDPFGRLGSLREMPEGFDPGGLPAHDHANVARLDPNSSDLDVRAKVIAESTAALSRAFLFTAISISKARRAVSTAIESQRGCQLENVAVSTPIHDVLPVLRIEHIARRITRGGRRARHGRQVEVPPSAAQRSAQLMNVAVGAAIYDMLPVLCTEGVASGFATRCRRASHHAQVELPPSTWRSPDPDRRH
jgi:hypothetical protein